MAAKVEVDGVALTAQAYGRFHQAVASGNAYYAHQVATGVAPGTAIGTTPSVALEMGALTKWGASILQISMGYASGTLGAGYSGVTSGELQDVPLGTTGTRIIPRNAQIANRDHAKAMVQTSGTVVAGDVVRVCFSFGAALATTAVFQFTAVDNVDGGLLVLGGARIAIEATAAGGSTPLAVYSILWQEIKL